MRAFEGEPREQEPPGRRRQTGPSPGAGAGGVGSTPGMHSPVFGPGVPWCSGHQDLDAERQTAAPGRHVGPGEQLAWVWGAGGSAGPRGVTACPSPQGEAGPAGPKGYRGDEGPPGPEVSAPHAPAPREGHGTGERPRSGFAQLFQCISRHLCLSGNLKNAGKKLDRIEI